MGADDHDKVAAIVMVDPAPLVWTSGCRWVVNGWTVGAGHFNMMEVPDQVNGMIEGFLRQYV